MINAGTAKGTLDLNASGFFGSIQSAITELHNLKSASTDASGGVQGLEDTLSAGAGGGLSGAMSETASAASGVADEISGIGSSSENAEGKTKGFGDKLKSAWDHMKNAIPDASTIATKLKDIGNKAQKSGGQLTKYITTPLAALGIYSVKTSMTFEKAMSQVQATMGASKEDMVELEEAAKNMGETTQYTNTQAAEALNYLALAGYDTKQMIAALPSVLNLAAAGNMDLAEASDMLTDGLSALGLASKDSDELMKNMNIMVDQMARTASRSNTSVAQLGEAILTVGGTATYLSGGLSEVNQVIGLMADRGIKASEAGTHLRNIILAMQPATDAAKQAFLKVGLAMEDTEGNFVNLAYDAEGNMKPLSEIFSIIQKGMSNMSDMEKQGVLADIFHRTDLAAANALIGTSTDRWKELGDEIENSAGAGAQMAETQLDNLAGEMTLLKSKIEALATTIGEKLAPVVSDLVDDLGDLVGWFSELDPDVQEAIIKAGLLVAALGPVLKIIGLLVSGAGKVVTAFSTLFKILGPLLKSGFAALAAPATLGLGTIFAAIAAAIVGWEIGSWIYDKLEDEINGVLWPFFDLVVSGWHTIADFFTKTIPQFFLNLGKDIVLAFAAVKNFFTDTVPNFFKKIFTLAWLAIKSAWDGVVGFFQGIWNGIKNAFSAVGTWFKDLFVGAWKGIKTAWYYVVDWFKNIWEGIKNAFAAVGTWFKDLFKSAWEGIKSAWSSVVGWFQGIWSSIKNAFSAVGTWFKNIFTEAWNGIKSVFSGIGDWFDDRWEDIKDVFRSIPQWFGSKFQEAWSAIKNAFSSVGEWFSGLWEDLKEIFVNIGTAVGDAVSSGFKTVWNFVIDTVEDIANLIPKVINGAISILNKLPGVDISELDDFDFSGAKLAVGLDYVPYDDYQAILHKGERVLTKEENEEYTSGNQRTGDTYIFNSPEPIDEVEAANQIKRIKQELAEGF